MEHIRAIVTVGLVFGTIALAGCKSKQQVAAQLQAEYKTAYAQYYKDCIAPAYGGANEYFTGKKAASPTPAQQQAKQQQCAVEGAKVDKLQKQIDKAAGY